MTQERKTWEGTALELEPKPDPGAPPTWRSVDGKRRLVHWLPDWWLAQQFQSDGIMCQGSGHSEKEAIQNCELMVAGRRQRLPHIPGDWEPRPREPAAPTLVDLLPSWAAAYFRR